MKYLKPHTAANGNTLTERDHVLIDAKWHATVIISASTECFLSHRLSDSQPGERRLWYANERLTLFTEEMQAELIQQQALAQLEHSRGMRQARSLDALNAPETRAAADRAVLAGVGPQLPMVPINTE